jgi:hypothetical protein
MLLYGIIRHKPSYLMPYFSIKVFQVVMASLTTLGFYSCLPDVRLWIQNHQYFPFKARILLLDNQTLELFVFSILLTSILAKLYAAIIVWYCYRYIITFESFSNLNSMSSGTAGNSAVNNGIVFDDSNNVCLYKLDEESIMSLPPKYEDVVKHPRQYHQAEAARFGGHVAVASSTVASTSNNPMTQPLRRNSSIDESSSIHSENELSNIPSYSTVIASNHNHRV